MITIRQKALVYVIALLASYLFTWPIGLMMTLFFFDVNGHLPLITANHNDDNETTEHL